MKMEKLGGRFIEFEEEHELVRDTINDINYWIMIRKDVFADIAQSNDLYDMKTHTDDGTNWWKLKTFLKNFIDRNPFFAEQRDYWINISGRREKIKGEYINKMADPVARRLDATVAEYPLEQEPHHHKLSERSRGYTRYLDLIETGATLLNRLNPHSPLTSAGREKLRELEQEIEERFGADTDIEGRVENRFGRFKVLKRLYRLLMRIKNPEKVLIAPQNQFGLTAACKDLGIPVLELQHGLISPYHFDYHYPETRPDTDLLPDRLLVWGQRWARDDLYTGDVCVMGFPFMSDQQRSHAAEERQGDVLIVSQWDRPGLFNQLLEESIEDGKVVGFKPHPHEEDSIYEQYPIARDSPAVTVHTTEDNLYRLFMQYDAVVGASSTALFEALAFNRDVYAIRDESAPFMERLFPENHLIESIDSITPGSAGGDTGGYFRTDVDSGINQCIRGKGSEADK